MLCKCGATMGSSESPSPYNLSIYYANEADDAIKADPTITLHNFLLDWDDKKGCQHAFMQRKEAVDYWYCPICKRVYETQVKIGGRWIRIYKLSDIPTESMDYSAWKRVYVMPETETDAVTEEDPDILLIEYLKDHNNPIYYLSADETRMHAVDVQTGKVVLSYEQEDRWNPDTK